MKLQPTCFRYTPDPGTVEGPVYCGVCGEETQVRRGLHGPRSFAEAMGRHGSDYDCFSCAHGEETWHKQVVKLRQMARDTPSSRIEAILLAEAEEVLAARCESKEGHFLF